MKLFICTIAYTLLSLNLWAQQGYSVTGNIKDEKGKPLQAVTVFIDGSDKYTATDANGNYTITTIQPGTYRIATSMVGRNSERQTVVVQNHSITANFIMKIKAISLNEVVIGTDSRRAEMLKLFFDKFIGTTENAKSCKIINQQIIEFTTNKNILLATTPDFLTIENQNLGYRIKYLLKIFRYDKKLNLTSYTGDCIFEELPGTKKQNNTWIVNRKKAYEGSFMHYLRSLYTGNLKEQKFRKFAFIDSAKIPTVDDKPVDMNQYVTRIDSNFIKLSFKQRFKVEYHGIVGFTVKTTATSAEREQAYNAADAYVREAKFGIVKLFLDYTIVDRNGHYLDYRSFLLEGLWNTLQVGDRLPYTYQP
jgi:hypothetical protein